MEKWKNYIRYWDSKRMDDYFIFGIIVKNIMVIIVIIIKMALIFLLCK